MSGRNTRAVLDACSDENGVPFHCKVFLKHTARGVPQVHQLDIGCDFTDPRDQSALLGHHEDFAIVKRGQPFMDHRSPAGTFIDDRDPHRRFVQRSKAGRNL